MLEMLGRSSKHFSSRHTGPGCLRGPLFILSPSACAMVAQFEVSCWACHAMHKVSSSRPPLACWRISSVWSVCIEQLL